MVLYHIGLWKNSIELSCDLSTLILARKIIRICILNLMILIRSYFQSSDDDTYSRRRSCRRKPQPVVESKGSPAALTPPPSRFLESSDEETKATMLGKENT